MPTYEYFCTTCGEKVDQRRLVDERNAPRVHDGCRGFLRRKLSLPQPAIIGRTYHEELEYSDSIADDPYAGF